MTKHPVLMMILCGAAAAQLPAFQATTRPQVMVVARGSYLGVGVKEIDSERAKALKLREEQGVEITSVESDSPADKAGLKAGDVVLEYNGHRVDGSEQFVRLVRETPVSRPVKLTISRNGAPQTLTATTAARKSFRGEEFAIAIPRFEMPVMPDVPKAFMSWRSSILGVEAESLEGQLADFFGAKEGVLVRSVMKGSAAEKAGLKAGDVITKVEDTRVSSPREVSSAVRSPKPKRTFTVTVVRERRESILTVTMDDDRSDWDPWRTPERIVRRLVDVH